MIKNGRMKKMRTAILLYGDQPDFLRAKVFRFKRRKLGAAELLEVGRFIENLRDQPRPPKYVRMFFVGEGLGAELDVSLAAAEQEQKSERRKQKN